MEEAAKKLDRKRSHGTVYGDPNVGFVQDEKYYRHDGTLYMPAAPATAAAPQSPPEPVTPVSDERRAAQSEAMKKVWAERREALAHRRASESQAQAE